MQEPPRGQNDTGSEESQQVGFLGRSEDTAKQTKFPTFLSWLKSMVAGEIGVELPTKPLTKPLARVACKNFSHG